MSKRDMEKIILNLCVQIPGYNKLTFPDKEKVYREIRNIVKHIIK